MTAPATTTPLRSPQLRRIVVAYTVNRLGTWFGFIALSVAIFDHTHSAIAVAGMLLAGLVLPAFLVPVLVTVVETSTRRGQLSGLYLFEATATAALAALLLWHFSLAAILLLVTLDGIAALAASALLRAAAARRAREWAHANHEPTSATERSVPAHTHAGRSGRRLAAGEGGGDALVPGASASAARETIAIEAERRTNAALNMGFAVTFTLGPALAGVVVTTLGTQAALWIDVVSFVICGAMLLDIKPHVEDAETSSVRARMRAAWQYINDATVLRRLLLAQSVALVFFAFSPPIEVAYAKVSLHAGDQGYGVLLGVWGLGVAIGSIVFARSIKRSLGALLSGSTLAVGVAYLGWAAAPSLTVACAAGLIGGIGNGVQEAALISAVQRLTPRNLQGRLMGAVESLGAICPALGFLLGSAITVLSSPRTAFLVAGLGATVSTVAFVRLRLDAVTGTPRARADASAHLGTQKRWAPDRPLDAPLSEVSPHEPAARPEVASEHASHVGPAGTQAPPSAQSTR